MMSDAFSFQSGLQDTVQQLEEEAQPNKTKIETYTDETGLRFKIDATYDEVQQIVQGAKKYAAIEEGFARANFEKARQTRENPWANIATTIAGSLAAGDKDMPGWVQGLGRASLALNPSPDELERRGTAYAQSALQQRLAAIRPMEQVVAMEGALATREETNEIRKARNEADAFVRRSQVMTQATDKATKMVGKYVTNPTLYRPLLRGTGMSQEEVDQQANEWAEQAKTAKAHRDLVDKTRADLMAERTRAYDAHNKASEKIASRGVAVAEARAKLEENIKTGKMVNPLAWLQERRRLLQMAQAAQDRDLRTLIASDRAQADIATRYLQNKMLDDDGGFGDKVIGLSKDISEKAKAGTVMFEEQGREIRALIAAGDAAYEATTGTKPAGIVLATPTPATATPNPAGLNLPPPKK